METALGCGYSINDEFGITDFYSPPSSIIDENELFYLEEDDEEEEEEEEEENYDNVITEEINNTDLFSSSSDNDIKPLKLMSIETTTPPPTPLITQRLFDPINHTTMAFQNMTINTNQSLTSSNWLLNTSSTTTNSLYPYQTKTTTATNLLTPTSMDRYLIEHCRLYKSSTPFGTTTNRHESISVQHTQVTNETTSRLYSYMTPMENFDNNNTKLLSISSPTYIPQQMNMKNNNLLSQRNNNSHDPWILSEISTILQQNTNISLSATAQQILAGNSMNNNRPLRSEKIDIEVIKHLIQEANWKRQCGMKKEVCVFCRNNGENELIYSSHSLKDLNGNVTCPILRAYQCPICGATGAQAHTIKYCQATGDDNNRHVPTPYEKMLRMQIFGFDDNITPSIPAFFGQIDSPSALYTNGWSDSYL